MRRSPLAALSLCLAVALPAAAPAPASAEPAPIIGGTTTTVGQYPTVVALTIGGNVCTGTLIHREWVLTAAHCLLPAVVGLPSQEAVTESVRVHFGTVDLTKSAGDVRRAAATIPKPGFQPDKLGQHDIGLVRLAQPASGVVPTPVNFDAARAPIGAKVTMVGFGATEQGGTGTVGVAFAIEDRTSTACTAFGWSDANLLCFSQLDNKGKCRGDSGGPSLAELDGQLTLVGVTSFGDLNCAQVGADTRTDAEKQFIETHVPSLTACDGDGDCTNGICFDGRCIATPFGPGGLGSTCAAADECDSRVCAAGPDGQRCTQSCTAGAPNACPEGFDCLRSSGPAGACWPSDGGGCCDASGRGAPTMLLGLGLVALVLRRRRLRR